MPNTLCFLVCQNFLQEVNAAILAEGWTDVQALAFESRCGRPPVSQEELQRLLPPGCREAVVLGSACIKGMACGEQDGSRLRTVVLEQCFHLVVDPSLSNSVASRGGYQVTPAWLADWPAHLRRLGLTTESSGDFFRDTARELVLYDTGSRPEPMTHLKAMSDAVGLPARRIAVGQSHTRLLLAALVHDWRNAQDKRHAEVLERERARELAAHVLAMDLLAQLAKHEHEEDVLRAIEDLFSILFAPKTCRFLAAQAGQAPRAPDLEPDWAWTPSGQGFLLCVTHENQLLGHMEVDGLAYPQFRQRYLNMALAMAGVCALAIVQTRSKAELKRTYEQLAHSRLQLHQAEKMAAVGTLAAGVAHEINNPVGFVKSNLGTLAKYSETLLDVLQDYADAEKQLGPSCKEVFARVRQRKQAADLDFMATDLPELVAESLDGIGRVSKIVTALIDFAQPGSPQWQWSQLQECLDSTLVLLAHQLHGKAEVVRLYNPVPDVFCQTSQLTQVMLNVLTNALQAVGGHGRITLRTGCEGPNVWFEVEDDGCGIDEAHITHIFEPFFTTKPVNQAIGMGLAVAWGVVNQHQGQIVVKSTPPHGTVVKVLLPIKPGS
jgi:signal transduction histidine kinase